MPQLTLPAALDAAPRFQRTRASLYLLLAIILVLFEVAQIWSGVQNVRRWRNLADEGHTVDADVTGWGPVSGSDEYEVWIAFTDADGVAYSGRMFVSATEATHWEIEVATTLPVIYHPAAPWLVYRLVDAADPPLLWQVFLTTNPDTTWWGTVVAFIVGMNAVLIFWLWRAWQLWGRGEKPKNQAKRAKSGAS